MPEARWFFRVIETHAGEWACRRGRQHIDGHRELKEALAHITAIAAAHAPAEVFVHRIDGSVRSVGIIG